MENHRPDSRNNTRRSVAPGLCGHSLLDSLVGHGNSLYRGERILVNKWSYGLRLPFMAWLGYHRWGDKPVRKDDIIVFNNPANLKEPVADRREVFINRCIGTPGDTLLIDSLFSVVSSEQDAPDQKFLYAYPRNREKQLDSLLPLLNIKPGPILGQDSVRNIRSFSRYEAYLLEQSLNICPWIEPLDQTDSARALKPLIVPGKGKVLRVYPWNRTLLCNTLVMHEHRQAEIRNDTLSSTVSPHSTATSPKTITGWCPTIPSTCPTRASSGSCPKTTS